MPARSSAFDSAAALRRGDAAQYCGVSPGYFDRMVAEGLLPAPRQLGSLRLWARRDLDLAIDALPQQGPMEGENTCDRLFGA
ncbi:MAG TPA: hypothetical protein PKD10_17390 [Paracoccaceae bacterium]|nr:hypothetical protein [Paracoccaceae bacterium]HMO73311.1 hypothetical protein [Paracoccaceae bacterium]